MTHSIDIRRMGDGEPLRFAVSVREDGSTTHHDVTLTKALCAKHSAVDPERIVDAAFRFLLDRESKDSILARFDLAAIARYFPEFETTLPRYLS
ncbi:MAG: hypothetical protein ABSD74_13060 [Rhizomicrobium sp.]|jgi:hypothetical protein